MTITDLYMRAFTDTGQVSLRQGGRCPSKDLVLRLEQPVALLQLPHRLNLLGRQAGTVAVLDAALHPLVRQAALGEPEIRGDLGQWPLVLTGSATTSTRNSFG